MEMVGIVRSGRTRVEASQIDPGYLWTSVQGSAMVWLSFQVEVAGRQDWQTV